MIKYEILTVVKIDGTNTFLFQGNEIYDSGVKFTYLGMCFNNNPKALNMNLIKDNGIFHMWAMLNDLAALDKYTWIEKDREELWLHYRERYSKELYMETYRGFTKTLKDMGL